jgi:HEAT repeat protein
MRTQLICSLVVWLAPCLLVCARAYDQAIDSPMYRLPNVPMPPVKVVYVDAKALWLRALKRPEAELRCRAADAIARARQRGVKGLETTIPALLAALDRRDQHPTVRLAVARALIVLEAKKEAGPSLLRHAQSGGTDLRELIEPALARWKYEPAGAAWLKRLRDPATTPRNLLLAIRGLSALREGKAADRLRELALSNRESVSIRLEAAQALGLLRARGLEKDAARLAADSSARGLTGRLAAAALLHRHRSKEAIGTLQRLAQDANPAVAARAVAPLLGVDPKLIPAPENLLAGPDAALRSLAVEVFRREPTEQRIPLLADHLDDHDPKVRVQARRALEELAAKKEFRDRVITAATRVLGANEWRGLEQATILLARLDHKPAADRFLELLDFNRPEVYITAAWGLRKLAVRKTLPAVTRYVGAKEQKMRADTRGLRTFPFITLDHQLSQLNQLLGQEKYGPADAVLRRFIPRLIGMGEPGAPESRAAAIWALGMIHEGKAVDNIVTAVEGRLNDTSSQLPENERVRYMSAITLGRMKANKAKGSLQKLFPKPRLTLDRVTNACAWALTQLTGKAMPPPTPIEYKRREGFLLPDK